MKFAEGEVVRPFAPLIICGLMAGCGSAQTVTYADDALEQTEQSPVIANHTGKFCLSTEAERIYGNTKACAMEVCTATGDLETCEIARDFSTQHAPESGTVDHFSTAKSTS